jgi:hypothetical protein
MRNADLPNDEPMLARLAWPDGMAVVVGPLDFGGIKGVVDWSFNPRIPGDCHTPPSTMLREYGCNMVPVRRGLEASLHHQRWLVPAGGKH